MLVLVVTGHQGAIMAVVRASDQMQEAVVLPIWLKQTEEFYPATITTSQRYIL